MRCYIMLGFCVIVSDYFVGKYYVLLMGYVMVSCDVMV